MGIITLFGGIMEIDQIRSSAIVNAVNYHNRNAKNEEFNVTTQVKSVTDTMPSHVPNP